MTLERFHVGGFEPFEDMCACVPLSSGELGPFAQLLMHPTWQQLREPVLATPITILLLFKLLLTR